MNLQSLSQLGLPEWVVIIAALVFIFERIGLFKFLFGHIADKREHSQASENVAIEILRSIIRESIQEHSKESQELRNIIYRYGKQLDQNTQSIRTLTGIISEKD